MKLKAFSLAALVGVLSLSSAVLLHAAEAPAKGYRVYVGTYTTLGQKEGKGIYAFEFNPQTGKATTPQVVAECANPTFLAIGPGAKNLYAVIEVSELSPTQKKTGGVASFKIDPATGGLTPINMEPAQGTSTCHVSLDRAGKFLLVANYGTGKTALTYPIKADGSIGPVISAVEHTGSSENLGRQKSPHGHSINLSPDERFAIVADLGIDQLKVYPFDINTGKLDESKVQSVKSKAGAGPRHFTFHPNKKYAYHNNELDWTVTAYRYEAEDGKLVPLQTLSTIPPETEAKGGTAEVLVHPNGKFLYVSNRGPDTLAIFHLNEDGTMKAAGHASTLGKFPRNFVIEPSGKYLLAANQNSDDIFVFEIDQQTGALTPTGEVIKVPMPVCLRLVPLN